MTEPTKGRAVLHGLFCGLLEVGTGFHPELTGRDNVYMSGAILGMKRREIARKFDEIVAFAEVERFIDTPVKHYSSGMYVRLGFSVLAHMDPLHSRSWMKCWLWVMSDFKRNVWGRWRMWDSTGQPSDQCRMICGHSFTRLCKRAILLNKGEVVHEGSANEGGPSIPPCRPCETLRRVAGPGRCARQ